MNIGYFMSYKHPHLNTPEFASMSREFLPHIGIAPDATVLGIGLAHLPNEDVRITVIETAPREILVLILRGAEEVLTNPTFNLGNILEAMTCFHTAIFETLADKYQTNDVNTIELTHQQAYGGPIQSPSSSLH